MSARRRTRELIVENDTAWQLNQRDNTEQSNDNSGAGELEASEGLSVPVESYDIEIDGDGWQEVGEVTEYEDDQADEPVLQPGEVSVSQGEHTEHVQLQIEGADIEPGAPSDYRVRGTNAEGPGEASEVADGYTDVGEVAYQWERSDVDEDADYSVLTGATTASFEDGEAPENGEGRYYRVVVEPEGGGEPSVTSESARGFRAVEPAVETLAAANVGIQQATLQGDLFDVGIPSAEEHGFCYDTSPTPSVDDADAECIELGVADDQGEFSTDVDGLEAVTTSHVRAFVAHEHLGEFYGDDVALQTNGCGSGSLEGNSCTPNDSPWPGAEVTVEGTDCDGEPCADVDQIGVRTSWGCTAPTTRFSHPCGRPPSVPPPGWGGAVRRRPPWCGRGRCRRGNTRCTPR